MSCLSPQSSAFLCLPSSQSLLLLCASQGLASLASDLHPISAAWDSLYILDMAIISQRFLLQFNMICPSHPSVYRTGNWQPGQLNKEMTRLAGPPLCCPSAHTNPIQVSESYVEKSMEGVVLRQCISGPRDSKHSGKA
jgi:hypothetical protein